MHVLYLLGENEDVVGMEWDLECGHLVQNAARCPDVRLLSIGLVFNQLWTGRRREEVKGGYYYCGEEKG